MLEMYDNKVAVIPLFDRDVSPGGIIIPEMAKERCDQGIVKYCGPNCKWLKPGDYVLFSGYTGQAIRDEVEGTLIMFREDSAVAIIADDRLPTTEVPGLYFKGPDGYFPANYEQAMAFIARALDESGWNATLKSRNMEDHRPKEDYAKR